MAEEREKLAKLLNSRLNLTIALNDINNKLESCFKDWEPRKVNPKNNWERITIYMPLILIVLPIVTSLLSWYFVAYWKNDGTVFINFANAIPAAIAAVAANLNKTKKAEIEESISINSVYILLTGAKSQIAILFGINLTTVSQGEIEVYCSHVDTIISSYNKNKDQIDTICAKILTNH